MFLCKDEVRISITRIVLLGIFFVSLILASCNSIMIYEPSDEAKDHSFYTGNLTIIESGSVSYINPNDIGLFGKIPEEKLLADVVCNGRIYAEGHPTRTLFGECQDYTYSGEIKSNNKTYNIHLRIRVYNGSTKHVQFSRKNKIISTTFYIERLEDNYDGYTFPITVAQLENNSHKYTVAAVYEQIWISTKTDEDTIPIDKYTKTTLVRELMQTGQKFQFLEDDVVVAELIDGKYVIFENAETKDSDNLRMNIGLVHILVNIYEKLGNSIDWPYVPHNL